MAWVATDTFESYSHGNTLAGLNGGTGWAGAWTETDNSGSQDWDISNAQKSQGSLSMHLQTVASGTSETQANRDITTAIKNETFYVDVRCSKNTGDQFIYIIGRTDALLNECYIRFNGNDGQIAIFDNSSYDNIQAYSANTWYTIGIEFDVDNDQYRANVDGGAFSAWKAPNGGTFTGDIKTLRFIGQSTDEQADFYIDDIRATEANTPVAGSGFTPRITIIT
jgi:hypothetical protein